MSRLLTNLFLTNRRTPLLSVLLASGLLFSLSLLAWASVDLEYFVGSWQGDSVLLEWATGSEGDTLGFYVWRSTEPLPIINGQIDQTQATKLNPDEPIVNPDGACNLLNSQEYEYVDNTVSDEVEVYYYYLENIGCNNSSTFYGEGESGLPIAESEFTLYLPVTIH